MKSILVLSFSEIRGDPRVSRQIERLSGKYDVTSAGFGAAPYGVTKHFELPHPRQPKTLLGKVRRILPLIFRRFDHYYWIQMPVRGAVEKLADSRFDLIISNDIETLPVAAKLARGAKILVDAHEYAPREFDDQLLWRILFQPLKHYLCKKYLNAASGMTTVCAGIAKEYKKQFDILPTVVLNAPEFRHLSPSPMENNAIHLVHHGVAIRSRHLETMIDMFNYLDGRFTLDFMLVPNDTIYLKELQRRASFCDRIRFVEPVPMKDIVSTINRYDLGVFILPPVNFNYTHALPNKFFEFVQARLGVAIGPSPEMAALVRRHGLGVISNCFDASNLAFRLNNLKASDVWRFKNASDTAARHLSFESSGLALDAEIKRILGE